MAQASLVGTSVGRYIIESVIGRGGMGVVYLARDEDGQPVALKLMAPEVAGNAAFRERFLREAGVMLEHPNVVPIYDAGEVDDELFIAMRYVAGADLKKLILSEKKLEPARAVAIVEQAAAGLDAAHENRIVHRDVKPQNILIETDDGSERVYLTDFGLIKRISADSSFTTGQHLMGTVYYMAPEQIAGKAVDGRADVYSLGCIAYECLTGSVPYDFETEAAVLWAHMNSTPPTVTESLPLLPTEVDSVVAKALARSPDDRYLTAGELAVSLGMSLGVSVGRPRSLWGSRMSVSGRQRRPALRPAPVSVAQAQSFSATKGFVVGAAAVLLAAGIALGVGSGGGPKPVAQVISAPTNETIAGISERGDSERGDSESLPALEGWRSSMLEGKNAGSPSAARDPLLLPTASELDLGNGSRKPSGSGKPDAPRIPAGALEHRSCQGLLPAFWVPADRVEAYVDDRFTLMTQLQDDGSGSPRSMAQINVLTFSCDVDLAGDSLGQTERVIVAATIERPKVSPVDATAEFYILSWFESNQRVVDWYNAVPTLRSPGMERVPKLDQRFGPVGSQGAREVRFTAPPSASSPFRMKAVMERPIPRLPSIIARWWTPHRRGALMIQDEVHEASFPAADGNIILDDRAPDSLLERFFAPGHTRGFAGVGNAHVSGVAITTKRVFVCGDEC